MLIRRKQVTNLLYCKKRYKDTTPMLMSNQVNPLNTADTTCVEYSQQAL